MPGHKALASLRSDQCQCSFLSIGWLPQASCSVLSCDVVHILTNKRKQEGNLFISPVDRGRCFTTEVAATRVRYPLENRASPYWVDLGLCAAFTGAVRTAGLLRTWSSKACRNTTKNSSVLQMQRQALLSCIPLLPSCRTH